MIRISAIWLSCLLCCCFFTTTHAQYFTMDNARRVTIPFKLVRNLVIIELKINNKGPYNFILDTGVGFMLITEPTLVDSIKMEGKRTIKMSGFGEGDDFDAYVTPPLKIDIPGLISHNVAAAILKKDHFSLSNYAGIPIHGLLGYEFFNHLAVNISFTDSIIRVSDPKNMRFFKKGTRIPITIENKKPYLNTKVVYANGTAINSKLIIDLGAGHFISLENVPNKNTLQKKFINASLGMGIRGLISGSLSRIQEVDLGKYKLKNVIAAFPDEERSLSVPRDGNIGISLLKKFDIIFDYPNGLLYLKSRAGFGAIDEHDMSGLWYYASGDGYNHLIINKVDPGSAADDIGLEKDDEIVSINLRPVSEMSLQHIDELFKSQNGRTYLLRIYRDKKYYTIPITLKRRI
ncbi:MAG: Aspartyl protease [Mucilaginibacter sp.]|nr:Aspartyl protease [Mucilaginibacter sp.]